VRGDDADVPRAHVHELDLPRRPTRESQDLVRERAEPEGVVCGLVHRDQVWRLLEAVQPDAVLEDDRYPAPRQLHASHGGECGYFYGRLARQVVPYDDLAWVRPSWVNTSSGGPHALSYLVACEFGESATADKGQIIGRTHHLNKADASIKVYDPGGHVNLHFRQILRQGLGDTSGGLEKARLGLENWEYHVEVSSCAVAPHELRLGGGYSPHIPVFRPTEKQLESPLNDTESTWVVLDASMTGLVSIVRDGAKSALTLGAGNRRYPMSLGDREEPLSTAQLNLWRCDTTYATRMLLVLVVCEISM
jgi:hypothetical protein